MPASDRSLLANLAFRPRIPVAMELFGWLWLGLLLSLARFAIQISISNRNSVGLERSAFPRVWLSRAGGAAPRTIIETRAMANKLSEITQQ